jgi:hypothetical protein
VEVVLMEVAVVMAAVVVEAVVVEAVEVVVEAVVVEAVEVVENNKFYLVENGIYSNYIICSTCNIICLLF